MSLESKSPEPWVKAVLPEVSELIMGQSPSSSDVNESGEGVVFFQGKAEFGKLHPTPKKYCTEPKKVAKSNDILLSIRAPVGPTNIANQPTGIGRGLAAIRALGGVEYKYLFYFFRAIEPWMSEQGTGSTFKAISGQFLKELPIELPPLAEQQEIAARLDTLLAQVDTLKGRLDALPAILKRFRQSVLAAAVSGKLTDGFHVTDSSYYETIQREITADPKLKKLSPLKIDEIELAAELFGEKFGSRWKLFCLEQLVEVNRGIPYGIVQTGEAQEKGIPTIRCGDVQPLSIRTESLKKVLPNIEEKYTRTRLQGGEVILAIRGTVGNAAVVTKDIAALKPNISREVAMIPVRENVEPKFIALLLQSPGGFRCLAEKTKGVAQKGINLADVKRFVTPLPTREEQTEIVRRVEQLFAFADQIEQRVKDAQARVNHLTQSILAKAFRGELTADWRQQHPELITGEHSAEALLARIQAERASHISAQTSAKRGRKKASA